MRFNVSTPSLKDTKLSSSSFAFFVEFFAILGVQWTAPCIFGVFSMKYSCIYCCVFQSRLSIHSVTKLRGSPTYSVTRHCCRLRPHPSLRDRGLRFPENARRQRHRHWWSSPIVLKYQRIQITNTFNQTSILQINGVERTSLISRNRYHNGSTTNVSTVSKIILLFLFSVL